MRDRKSPREPEAVWKEKDMSGGRKVDAMVIILRTRGCRWAHEGGCSMCGYNNASSPHVTGDDLLMQLDTAMQRYDDEPFVKIYTSGSFLDEDEIPLHVREEAFRRFGNTERLLFESRPEFVDAATAATLPPQSTIALGLESADDEVLRRSIRKGFTVADHRRAADAALAAGLDVRTYILLKPPFLSERAAMADTLESIRYASEYSTEISVNPLNVQRGTMVERLWRRGDYRSPWLWSLFKVIDEGYSVNGPRIMSSPSGGGTPRGVHNCPSCDRRMLEALERFSFDQDVSGLRGHECPCHDKWEDIMEAETAWGCSVDLERHLRNELAI